MEYYAYDVLGEELCRVLVREVQDKQGARIKRALGLPFRGDARHAYVVQLREIALKCLVGLGGKRSLHFGSDCQPGRLGMS